MKKIFTSIIIAIFLFSGTETLAMSIILGTTGTGPMEITVDADGNVYTTNLFSDNVTKITPAGVSTILGPTGSFPEGITIDVAGNIYTANSASDNVTKITPAGVSTILGTTGSAPIRITIDGAGNIYTTNQNSNNVTKITPAGVSTILGTTGSIPFGITIDGDGNIYTANSGSQNVTKITPDGVSTTTAIGTTGSTPFGITIDGDGNIYTANSASDNVTKITPAGVSTILGTTGGGPTGIAIDSAGNIYTTNQSSNDVSKITPDGVSTILGSTGLVPVGIILDSSENIYIANLDSNNVTKFIEAIPPIISQIAPVTTPTTDTTPDYSFTSTEAGIITYGGSCSSTTTTATAGANTITLHELTPGTYTDCTLTVTDTAGNVSNVLSISSFTIEVPSSSGSKGGSVKFTCKDPQASNYSTFGTHRASLCRYGTTTTATPTESNPFGGTQCPSNLLITDNMKNGDTNGVYSSYNKGKVSQISILQAHINRLLQDEYTQAAGPVDNYYRSKTKQGVERIQRKLNQLLPSMKPLVIDGIVGPLTKKAINMSC